MNELDYTKLVSRYGKKGAEIIKWGKRAIEENVPLPTPGGGGITDVTYEGLVSKIQAEELSKGAYYRITDYQTVYYPTKLKYGNWNPDSPSEYLQFTEYEVRQCEIEPLIVVALSENKLSHEAYSEKHPQDILHYDWNNGNFYWDISFTNYADRKQVGWVHEYIPGLKGVIYFRHDTKLDISTTYDWRNVKFRRWKYTGGDANLTEGVNNEYYPDAYISPTDEEIVINKFAKVQSDPEDYQDFYTFDGGEDYCYNVHIKGFAASNNPYQESTANNSTIVNIVFRLSPYFYGSGKEMVGVLVCENDWYMGIHSTFVINGFIRSTYISTFLTFTSGWSGNNYITDISNSVIGVSLVGGIISYMRSSSIKSFFEIHGYIDSVYTRGGFLFSKGSFILFYSTDTRNLRCVECNYYPPSTSSGLDLTGLYSISGTATFQILRTGNSVAADAYKVVYLNNAGEFVSQTVPRISFL